MYDFKDYLYSELYMKYKNILIITVLFFVSAVLSAQADQSSNKTALIISNDTYAHLNSEGPGMSRLTNTMDAVLRSYNFEVTTVVDASGIELKKAIIEFEKAVTERKGIALVLYNGHAVQFDGKNYLIPVDVPDVSKDEIIAQSVPMDFLFTSMQAAGADLNLMFFDASWGNPFTSVLSNDMAVGLASPTIELENSVIAFSTEPGTINKEHGRYSWELLNALMEAKGSIQQIIKRSAYETKFNGGWDAEKQIPAIYDTTSDAVYLWGNGTTEFTMKPGSARILSFDDCILFIDGKEIELPAGRWYKYEYLPAYKIHTIKVQYNDGYAEEIEEYYYSDTHLTRKFLYSTKKSSFNFVKVEKGSFNMGSPVDEEGRNEDEMLHEVQIKRNFYISETEVTQDLWKEIMDYWPVREWVGAKAYGYNYPAFSLSWYDAVEFCNKLSKRDGFEPCYKIYGKKVVCNFDADGYRLPTEAEWEYAARGGQLSQSDNMYSGSSKIENVAWYSENSGRNVHMVASLEPNELGIYDMSGNVNEFCWDWYSENYSEVEEPATREEYFYAEKVYKGGDMYDPASGSRIAQRFGIQASQQSNMVGIRLVRSIPASYTDRVLDSMALVEAGSFSMGSPRWEEHRQANESLHDVTLTRSFYMSKTEVVQKLWEEVMGTTVQEYMEELNGQGFRGMELYGEGPDYPMTYVSWEDAVEFCNKLSLLHGFTPAYSGTGKDIRCDFDADGYRLPTEAEWEYAARGGHTDADSFVYSGSNNGKAVGWVSESSRSSTHPVGQKYPNSLGLLDMTGNVREWCWDWHSDHRRTGERIDPTGNPDGETRVTRGGSWYRSYTEARNAYRDGELFSSRRWDIGFRVVRTARLQEN